MTLEVNSAIELHDSEILKVEKVKNILQERQGKGGINLEAFRVEAIERFAEAGFGVEVKVYETNVEKVYWFEFEINERLKGEFDPDQQVHEVTSDLLDLGEGGVIKSDGGITRSKSGLYVVKDK